MVVADVRQVVIVDCERTPFPGVTQGVDAPVVPVRAIVIDHVQVFIHRVVVSDVRLVAAVQFERDPVTGIYCAGGCLLLSGPSWIDALFWI